MAKHPIQDYYDKLLKDDKIWESLGIEYNYTAGTPIQCAEQLIIHGDGKSTFSTIRSRMDLAGEEIGTFESKINKDKIRALVQQLKDAGFESLPPQEGRSGYPIHRLAISIKGIYTASTFMTFPQEMEIVGDTLREIINIVRENKVRVLKLTLDTKKPSKGKPLDMTINFHNLGNEAFFLKNPIIMQKTRQNVFVIEYGQIPEEKEGYTSPPIEWKQSQLENLKAEKDEQNYIYLKPGEVHPISVPKAVIINEPGNYLMHLIYSNYELVQSVGGIPVLRGHAVSDEFEFSL